jgi:NADP-dependent 3-hydroxy acid dehydrogenase YdfG
MFLHNVLQFVFNDRNVSFFKTLNDNPKNYGTCNGSSDRNEKLAAKVAIITGASSGIGKALAYALAREKVNVVLAARNEKRLEEIRAKINGLGGSAISVPTDITDEQQCKALVKTTLKKFGQIDLLINNAGISMRANFIDLDLQVLKRLMDVNFWGMVYCTKYAMPYVPVAQVSKKSRL